MNPNFSKGGIYPVGEIREPSIDVIINVTAVDVVGSLRTLHHVGNAPGEIFFILGLTVLVHIVIYVPGRIDG